MKVAKLNGKLLTNIKSKTILGGNTQEKTVTPSTERQVITADSGYTCLDKVNVNAVTSAIDSNIKPENIKKDISILGVTGTMESASVPTKSWLYITEYNSNGYPIKAKTIGCSGDMPRYLCGSYDTSSKSMLSSYLQEFEINKGVTSIGYRAFFWCSSLTSITIPESVTSIGDGAFSECSSLTSITIPDGVTSIGNSVFYYCSSLTSITIPESVTSIEGSAFSGCRKLTSITIPDGVTSIGDSAFKECRSFFRLVMPSALTKIGNSAFYNCASLYLFDFRGATAVPTLNTSAIAGTPSKKEIVVPDNLYDTWIKATNWSNYASNIIKASDYEASL